MCSSVQITPDGKKVVTTNFSIDNTSDSYSAKIWDALSGKLLVILNGKKQTITKVDNSTIKSALFSPDGKKVVTVHYENTPKIWDVLTENY